MSDLLGNLVSKALNLAPTIEPRPLSRFEPWQPAGALESARLDSAAEREVQSAASLIPAQHEALPMENRRDAARLPVERPRLDPIDTDRLPVFNERIERGDSERPMRDSHVRLAMMPPTIASETPRAAEPPPTSIERVERLITDRSNQPQGETRPADDEWLHPSMITVPNVDVDRTRPAPTIETIWRPQTDRTLDAPTVVVQSISTPPSLDASTDKRPLPPRPTPLVERMPVKIAAEHNLRSDNMPTRPPAPPTIHVSIGRVEVRAALPPAPVKRSSSSTSTTSLDEYLRRRAGDRR